MESVLKTDVLELGSRLGFSGPQYFDALLKRTNSVGLPMTREVYLDLAYLGEPPEELGLEEEVEPPVEFRFGAKDKGENTAENLETLCNVHHDELHHKTPLLY